MNQELKEKAPENPKTNIENPNDLMNISNINVHNSYFDNDLDFQNEIEILNKELNKKAEKSENKENKKEEEKKEQDSEKIIGVWKLKMILYY